MAEDRTWEGHLRVFIHETITMRLQHQDPRDEWRVVVWSHSPPAGQRTSGALCCCCWALTGSSDTLTPGEVRHCHVMLGGIEAVWSRASLFRRDTVLGFPTVPRAGSVCGWCRGRDFHSEHLRTAC